MSHVLERLEALELRVATLERVAGLEPVRPPAPPVAVTVPSPAPLPVAPLAPRPPATARTGPPPVPPPASAASGDAGAAPWEPLVPDLLLRAPRRARAEPAPAGPARDLETWLGVVVLGRVGIGAVVLAAAYFAQLAYRHVSDAVKVLSLYALAGALLGVGQFLRARAGPRFVALLWGGAIAVAYVAGLAATLRYGLVDAWTGVALLAGAAALGQVLARTLRNEAIAGVSIVSAMLAPFLLDVAMSRGPVLLLYASGVHLWAAWTDQAWGWRWARRAALAGAALLALAWSNGPGLGSTRDGFLALHGLLLTLMAPDLVAAWRRTGPRRGLAHALTAGAGALTLWILAVEVLEPVSAGVRGGTLLSGALWLALATGLALRAEQGPARMLLRGLAEVGGVALALGTAIVWREQGPLPWGTLLSLAALTPALLLLRRRVDAGEAGAVTAAVAALLVVAFFSDTLCRSRDLAAHAPLAPLLLLAALVPAAALVLRARGAGVRVVGFFAGACTLGCALLIPTVELTQAWGAAALALPAAWALAAHERARRSGDRVLGKAVGVLAMLLGFLWAAAALRLDRPWVWPGAFDPHTWSALALAGTALVVRARGLSRRPGTVDFEQELMTTAVGLTLLAAGREVHLLTRDLSPSSHSTALALFGAASGLVLTLHARTGRRLGRAATGLGCLGAGSLLVLAQSLTGGLDGALVLALLGTGLGAALATEVLRHRAEPRPAWLALGQVAFLPLLLAWLAAADARPAQIHQALWNWRFAGGAGLTVLLAASTARALRSATAPAWRWGLGVGALVVGYLAGLFELIESTRALPGAWAAVLVSLYTALVAGGLLAVGFHWRLAPLRYAALCAFGVLVLKVGLNDLAASDLPLRVLVAGALGLVLLGSAYAYARRRRAAAPPPPEPPASQG